MEMFLKNRVLFARRQSWRRGMIYLLVTAFMLTGLTPPTANAAPRAANFPQIHLQLIASGFSLPVNLISAYDGTNRLFVVEKGGKIFILKDGVRQPTPFLDISSLVATCSECGLLGLAFPPDFAEEGYFFVNFTSKENLVEGDTGDPDPTDNANDTVIARFHLSNNPDIADPATKQHILVINQPAENHNGGHIVFGPDDYLYIGMGDGGGGGDTFDNAQNPASLHGKILRIDVGPTGTSYDIPPDNPFISNQAYRDEIWATGTRNPWRFGFDRTTGDFYVADVGQGVFEEVNFIRASDLGNGGINFGWPIMEGDGCYQSNSCDNSGLTLPITGYSHADGSCSINGGSVLRTQKPFQSATYVYGDFCTGKVWGVQSDAQTMASVLLLDLEFGITSFGEDEEGNVYVVDFGGGRIYQIVAAENFNYLPGLIRQPPSRMSSIEEP